jgi:hypothetical protein
MRWEVRFNNQMYHVFDTLLYTAIAGYKDRERAENLVAAFNLKEGNDSSKRKS